MIEPTVVLTDAPDRSDIEVIGQGLAAFNDSHTGIDDRRLLAVLVKDAGGKTVGGISGRSSLGLLFLDLIGRALHHQLPGARLLQTPWLARVRRNRL